MSLMTHACRVRLLALLTQTGVLMSGDEVVRAAAICEAAGAWLVLGAWFWSGWVGRRADPER
jgi:hypothetical protein